MFNAAIGLVFIAVAVLKVFLIARHIHHLVQDITAKAS